MGERDRAAAESLQDVRLEGRLPSSGRGRLSPARGGAAEADTGRRARRRVHPGPQHLGDGIPPPPTHRHRDHGGLAPSHTLRRTVIALDIGNIGKQREAARGGDGRGCGYRPFAPEKRATRRTSRSSRRKWLLRCLWRGYPLFTSTVTAMRRFDSPIGLAR